MDYLFQIVTYSLQRVANLLFSMSVDGISIGALIVAAALLMVIFRALVGMHLSVFNNRRGPTEEQEIAAARHRMEINRKARD